MKKLLLGITFIYLACISNAQNEAIPDSFHIQDWTDSEWVITDAYIYLDPEADNLIRDRYAYDENGNRELSSRDEWLYNPNGILLEYTEYLYIPNTGEWLTFEERYFQYDAEENVTSIEIYEYSSETFELEKEIKLDYFDYTPQGDYQNRIVYGPDLNDEWVVTSTLAQEIYYTSEDLVDSLVRINTTQDPAIFLSARSYEYDLEGNEIKESWWGQYDEITENFNLNFWFESIYEDGLLQSRTQYDYDENIPEGVFDFTNIYEYDEDGNLIFNTNQDWEDTDQAIVNDWRIQNFWGTTVSNENLELKYWNTIWNNENDFVLDLKIQGLDQAKEYKLSIFNMHGQLMHTLNLNNTSNINERFQLGSGSFFVTLKDDEGFRETTKVVLAK